jgi:HD-GYP domain-containing protein (c-di-GMP phosphodiesterase class II)
VIRRIGIRVKALLVVLPLIVMIVVVSAVASGNAARAGMLRLATRLLAFKTEQVRDFAFSQWQVLEELGYTSEAVYRRAAQASIQSYAGSLVRSPTEQVFAVSADGNVTLATSLLELEATDMVTLLDETPEDGWFEIDLADRDLVGQTFYFEPFAWQFYVVDDADEFYRDARTITVYHSFLLIGALIFAVAAVLLLGSTIMQPIEQLSGRMASISDSLDFSERVPADRRDELGELAGAFNLMTATVEVSQERLVEALQSAEAARHDTALREEETILMLGEATEFRDTETGSHIVRVGLLARLLSELIGADKDFQELIRKASPLHDIGKIGIPDSILLKPKKLTKAEFKQMEAHTTIGWRLLNHSRSMILRFGAEIALNHHEQWDGSGYPNGLKGDAIPLSGRIVRVVDVYDAIRSARPYKPPQTHATAVEFIREHRGHFFDPSIVDCLLANQHNIAQIYDNNHDTSFIETADFESS